MLLSDIKVNKHSCIVTGMVIFFSRAIMYGSSTYKYSVPVMFEKEDI